MDSRADHHSPRDPTTALPHRVVQIKVGATYEKDGTSYGLGLAYADWWTGYLPTLQRVLGPGAWNIELTPWGNQKVIARLTAFGGRIVHWSSGESEADDPNCGTSAEAQAKKRVCAEALGLGLYFYHAPKLWGVITHKGKGATFAAGEEERLKLELYGRMGLLHEQAHDRQPARAGTQPQPLSRNHVTPEPERLSRARAALADGERRAGVQPPAETGTAASDKQVGAILSLLRACREAGTQPATLNRIGNTVIPASRTSFRPQLCPSPDCWPARCGAHRAQLCHTPELPNSASSPRRCRRRGGTALPRACTSLVAASPTTGRALRTGRSRASRRPSGTTWPL
jgi:hypothetical protein